MRHAHTKGRRQMTQTDRVLIALTKPGPRTAQWIAIETGIPYASVRRVFSMLDWRLLCKAMRGRA